MAGSLSITDFSKVLALYPSIDGTTYTLPVRNVYQAAGATGLTTAGPTDTHQRLFPAHRAAHSYIHTTDSAGKVYRRRIPIVPTAATTPPTITGAIDGLTGWAYGGFIGEKIRGKL